jgi:hypothetical protein
VLAFTPDAASVIVPAMVTGTILPLGGHSVVGLAEMVMDGGALSMLMPLTVTGSAAFPALSTQLPVLVTDCPAPSELSVWPATVFVAIPDGTLPTSAQLKFTVTLVLFHPVALSAGERLPVMTGLVLSI